MRKKITRPAELDDRQRTWTPQEWTVWRANEIARERLNSYAAELDREAFHAARHSRRTAPICGSDWVIAGVLVGLELIAFLMLR
jgi:hypothetical protein